jgi:hypothetical protein
MADKYLVMNTIIIKNLIWQVILPLWAIVGVFGFYYFLKLGIIFNKIEKEAKKEMASKGITEFIKDNPGHPLVQELYIVNRKSLLTFFWMTGIILVAFFMGFY